ncbi:hypothetical protein CNO18_21635 [Gordonia sp. 1D]|nr:hypothetical protein CNO18_21635 [Gordonia sp. 1D]
MPTQAFDHDAFKKAVGQFPSGLTIVTGVDDGRPHGMTLQSFMSLSLEPALIAIAPARTSTTWPVIAETGSFAVNILSEQHSELARKFASSGGDRFESLDYTTTYTGNPILGETVTWFDCRIADILDGGDHVIVLGEVLELGQAEESTPREPIIFHRSGFRRLAEPTPPSFPQAPATRTHPTAHRAGRPSRPTHPAPAGPSRKRRSMRFGTFSAPYSHDYAHGKRTAKEVIDWDLQLVKWAEEYGWDEAFFAEHYTLGGEPSPAPDAMIAAASQGDRAAHPGRGRTPAAVPQPGRAGAPDDVARPHDRRPVHRRNRPGRIRFGCAAVRHRWRCQQLEDDGGGTRHPRGDLQARRRLQDRG